MFKSIFLEPHLFPLLTPIQLELTIVYQFSEIGINIYERYKEVIQVLPATGGLVLGVFDV